ncbi:hypothetical protein Ahy_B08g090661 isoform A [Arachis hypogaea]|uniref:DUF4283 domain-containing protein n=1 Tax=Arachis hypogaea TaxID=3818 RepID=A0A444Y0E7_ARAHY|nr:hypothetical protein Ahy_B08g090661 isoform A [Arachis hypogaea]
MGKRVGYAVKRRLEAMWNKKGTVDVIDLSNDFYLVKFYASEDFDFALMEGLWKVYDHYLTVRLWEPNFNPLRAIIDKITAWILRKIGNLIGRTVKVDNNTANLCRGKFALLCVEVDLTKPLMGKYLINGEEYHVEYEGIHQICFICGRIDHDQQHCNIRKEKEVAAGVESSEQSTYEKEENQYEKQNEQIAEEPAMENNLNKKEKSKQIMIEQNDNYGAWMVVQRPKRGKKNEETKQGGGSSRAKEKQSNKENQSRYSVLQVEDSTPEHEERIEVAQGEEQGNNNDTTKENKTTKRENTQTKRRRTQKTNRSNPKEK